VAGQAADLSEGATLAAAVIDDGRAAHALTALVRATNAPAGA
jgi:anthranilate phosphoribosyltransferase